MKKIHVNLGRSRYDILICHNEIKKIGGFIKELNIGTDAVVITNPLIKHIFGNKIKSSLQKANFNVRFELVPDSEKAKSEKYCIKLLNNISKLDSTHRRLFLVALGGGVIGDLAGFIASIYRRGIPYIQVPTTLLAQVDSAIGGKVAIDLKLGKNLAGSFYQPRLVFSDVSLLKSLSKPDLISGLAEVIKYGIIKSPTFFKFLEHNYRKILKRDKKTSLNIVYKCSSIKARVIEKDVQDTKGIRVILNLGHTIGHAIEAASGFSKAYTHGQAVALGILSASYISEKLGLLKTRDYLKIKNLIEIVGLPTKLKALDIQKILGLQEHDKKFIHGKNRFVLPVRIGQTVVKEGIPKTLVAESILVLYDDKV